MKKLLYILLLLPILSFGQTQIRTSQTNLQWVNASDYGIVGDSSTDNTTKFRAAIAALSSGGKLLINKPGKYLISDSLLINKAITIEGVGGQGSGTVGTMPVQPLVTIIMTSATKDAIVVNHNRFGWYNIGLACSATTPTAGHGILVNHGVGMRQSNFTITGFYINEEIVNGYLWDISNFLYQDAVVDNLIIRDVALPDGGDGNLHDGWFFAGKFANTDHILYTSGGGLKCNNLKFNSTNGGQNPRHCINITMTANTVDFLCTNSSFENFLGSALTIIPGSGVTYSDITFSGNQITPGVSSTSFNVVQLGNTTIAPSNVTINNNVFHSTIVGSGTGGSATGFNIWSNATFVTIGPNQCMTYNAGYTSNENYYFYSSSGLSLNRQQTIFSNPSGAGMTFDPALGINQTFTLTTSESINFKNVYPSNFKLYLIQDATGGRVVTWDGSVTPIVFTGSQSINLAANGVTVVSGYYDPTISKTVLTVENTPYLGKFTTSQRTALTGLVSGNNVYDTDVGSYYFYTGSAWVAFSALTISTGLTNTSGTVTNDLVTGKSGGGTVTGGTASGDNLTLTSTSNGTKGKIIFNPGLAAYDQTNNWLGMGTASPIGPFDNGGGNTTTFPTARFGTLLLQTLSTNNGTIGQNVYQNSGLTRIVSGYCSAFQFYNGGILMFGGTTASGNTSIGGYGFKYDFSNGGEVDMGGNGNAGPNDHTGYSLYSNSSGTFLNLTPTTSAGTFDILTRNASTKVIEKISSASVPFTQATADLTAQTTAGNVTTFTVGSSTATFNISGYINITAVTVDVIEMQVTYTDENSTSQTANFFTQGATSALLSAIGNSVYPPMTIRAKNGTVITVKTTLTTGTGSITFDAGSRITQL